jgi:ASC-1-like (ASCH) protein
MKTLDSKKNQVMTDPIIVSLQEINDILRDKMTFDFFPNVGRLKDVKIGTVLHYANSAGNVRIPVTVTDIRVYKTFRAALTDYGVYSEKKEKELQDWYPGLEAFGVNAATFRYGV